MGADPKAPSERSSRRSRRRDAGGEPGTMIPARGRRRLGAERVLMRLIATAGIVGLGTLLAVILDSQNVAGWIVGVAVSLLTVVLAAVLWSSREV